MVIISILRKHYCSSHLQCKEKHTLLQSVEQQKAVPERTKIRLSEETRTLGPQFVGSSDENLTPCS